MRADSIDCQCALRTTLETTLGGTHLLICGRTPGNHQNFLVDHEWPMDQWLATADPKAQAFDYVVFAKGKNLIT